MLRKTLNSLIAVALFISLLSGYAFALNKKEIVILHTNDIHGRVFPFYDKKSQSYIGGTTNLATKIAEMRLIYGKDNVLLLDAGDMSQGTPVSNIFYGDPITDYMNYVQYDCSTFGNHEFDWDKEQLVRQVERRKFPMVCANLVDKNTGKTPDFAKPYIIVEKAGMKIGIIGLATPSTPKMCFPKNVEDFKFLDPVEAVNKYKAELQKQGVKVIGIVSHNGYEEEKEMAQKLSGIDFIVGGHSHTVVPNPELVNGIPVLQAGDWGRYLGFAQLEIDADTGKLLSFKGRLIPITSYDVKLHEDLMTYENKVKEIMSEVIGEISADASNQRTRKDSATTSVGDIMTDIIKEITGSDIAICNTHGLRASLTKGPITREALFYVLPFDNTLMTFDVKGSDLKKIIEYYIDRPSYSQISGVTAEYDSSRPFGDRVVNIKVNGQPLVPDKTYKIGTIDFLYSVSQDCPEIQKAVNVQYGKFLRDEVDAYITKNKKVIVPEEIRIKVLKGDSPGERKRQ